MVNKFISKVNLKKKMDDFVLPAITLNEYFLGIHVLK